MATSDRKKQQLHADLVKANVVQPEETILAMTTGMVEVRRMGSKTTRNGSLVATEGRLIVFTKKVGGHDVQDFSYSMVASVDHKRGMMFGDLDIAASGDHTRVSMIPKDEVQEFATLVRQKIAEARSAMGATAPGPARADAPVDVMQQLKQLGELRESGVLTDSEFETKKAELLKRL